MNSLRVLTALTAAVLAAGALPLGANAGVITTFTSRGAFPGNDSLDWGQLAAPFTVVAAPFSATLVGGLADRGGQPGNPPFERLNKGYTIMAWTDAPSTGAVDPGLA